MTQERRHRRNYCEPGDAHELTFSCYRGLKLLKSERTCRWLAQSIEQARQRWNFDVWAYVFMPEHAHLIVHPRETHYYIAIIRRAIKTPVARRAIHYLEQQHPDWLKRITRRRGDKTERLFWQSGGGHDRNVQESKTLAKMIDYIHLNPVRRGLVERVQDWRWSSAAWFVNQAEPPLMPDRIPPEWSM